MKVDLGGGGGIFKYVAAHVQMFEDEIFVLSSSVIPLESVMKTYDACKPELQANYFWENLGMQNMYFRKHPFNFLNDILQ